MRSPKYAAPRKRICVVVSEVASGKVRCKVEAMGKNDEQIAPIFSTKSGASMKFNEVIDSQIDEQNFKDRQAMLRAIPRVKPSKDKKLAPGLFASGVWNRDISILDRRSVKAYLSGNGDLRVLWWKMFCGLHRMLAKRSSREWVMHDFHKMHHTITLHSLWLFREVDQLAKSIIEHGVAKSVISHATKNSSQKNIFSKQ